jgi:hypothetical protein
MSRDCPGPKGLIPGVQRENNFCFAETIFRCARKKQNFLLEAMGHFDPGTATLAA